MPNERPGADAGLAVHDHERESPSANDLDFNDRDKLLGAEPNASPPTAEKGITEMKKQHGYLAKTWVDQHASHSLSHSGAMT